MKPSELGNILNASFAVNCVIKSIDGIVLAEQTYGGDDISLIVDALKSGSYDDKYEIDSIAFNTMASISLVEKVEDVESKEIENDGE
jgi:hypothetical protein